MNPQDDDTAEDVRKSILETKLEHKMRARIVGVGAEKLAVNPVSTAQPSTRTCSTRSAALPLRACYSLHPAQQPDRY